VVVVSDSEKSDRKPLKAPDEPTADPVPVDRKSAPAPVDAPNGPPAPVPAPREPPTGHPNMDDFSAQSIQRIIRSTRWFLTAAVAGISIEILVKVVEHLDGFEFIGFLLHWLSRMVLVCDLVVYGLYVVIEFLLTVETLLKAIGIDIRDWWYKR
jgi:hypothetical protein